MVYGFTCLPLTIFFLSIWIVCRLVFINHLVFGFSTLYSVLLITEKFPQEESSGTVSSQANIYHGSITIMSGFVHVMAATPESTAKMATMNSSVLSASPTSLVLPVYNMIRMLASSLADPSLISVRTAARPVVPEVLIYEVLPLESALPVGKCCTTVLKDQACSSLAHFQVCPTVACVQA